MSPSSLGRVVERAFETYESQPGLLQIATGIAMGAGVTIASMGVFWLTLRILMDYFR